MKLTPLSYIEELEKDCRTLYSRVYIQVNQFDTWMLFQHDDISDYNFVRELQEAGVPCAFLGQNVATIKLYNENNRFKEQHRYAQLLRRGAKVRIDCCAPNGIGLFGIDFFVGWLDSYEFSDDGQFVTITVYDTLHFLKTQPSPWFRPSLVNELGLCEFIKYYLELCGLSQVRGRVDADTHWDPMYSVDSNITVKLKPLFDSTGTIGDVLTQIAQVALCAIYCDLDDVLQVQLIPRTRHLVYTFTDDVQVFSSASSTYGYTDYTDVSINVYDTCAKTEYSIKQTSQAYVGDSTLLVPGLTEYSQLELNNSTYPAVISITQDTRMAEAEVESGPAMHEYNPNGPKMPMLGPSVYIRGFDFMHDTMNLRLWAAHGVAADLKVYSIDEAREVGSIVYSHDDSEEESFFLMKKTLQIDDSLMTDKVYAQQCADTYARMISSAAHKIECECRGMPPLDLLDLVAITNPRASHDAEQVLITRFSYSFDGALSCSIESMSYATVVLLTYAFLAPGFYIPYDAGAVYISAGCQPADAGIVEGIGAYALGDTLRLNVVPRTGWKLDHWEDEYGNVIDTAPTYVARVDGSAAYVAVMQEDATFITITVDITPDNPLVTIPIMSLTPAVGTIDWGDGMSDDYDAQDEAEHRYDIAGTMTIVLKAPIVNLAFEIFANNSSINTFTAGSSVAYIPNGMFYNSSVKNVNFLPAKNAIFAGSYSSDYGPSQAYYTIASGSITGIRNTSALPSIPANDEYHSPIQINAFASGIMQVPGYYNGMVVNKVTVNSNAATQIRFPNTGLQDINLAVPFPSLTNVAFNGPVVNLNMYNVRGRIATLNISQDVQHVIVNNLTTLTTLHITGASPVVESLAKATTLTDIYLHDGELVYFAELPAQTINIHKPELTEFTVLGVNNNVNIINDIT